MRERGAFSEERAVELGFAREDLGARRKSRSVDGLRVARNRKPAKWAGNRKSAKWAGGRLARFEYLSNSDGALRKGVEFEPGMTLTDFSSF